MMVCTSARQVGIQFFRTLMLTILGLAVLGLLAGPRVSQVAGLSLLGSAVLAFLGFVLWTLGRLLAAKWITVLLLACSLVSLLVPWHDEQTKGWAVQAIHAGESVTSALLLGSMSAAMLLGHSYLIAPTMSIEPLKNLVLGVAASVAGRSAVAAANLAMINLSPTSHGAESAHSGLTGSLIAARWLIGLLGPAIIAWMVWQTARIRSTQSATGILYAGVILTFFGELVSEILSKHPQ